MSDEEPDQPLIRDAAPEDAAALAALIVELGYDVTAGDVLGRLAGQEALGTPTLVAVQDGTLIGCLTWHVTPVLHRPRPVGRITMLVVAEALRGQGIGAELVEEATDRARTAGCGLLEVTSNIRRDRAHHFYERLGFERTSYRFARVLA